MYRTRLGRHVMSIKTPNSARSNVGGGPVCSGEFILDVQTVQGTAIKNLFDSMKDILCDVNIVCNPSEASGKPKGPDATEFTGSVSELAGNVPDAGFQVLCMDSSHTALVSCKLQADAFESYHCEHKLNIGLNVGNIYKLLKSIGNNDSLRFRVPKADPAKLQIIIENSEKNTRTSYGLNLLDIDQPSLEIPDTEFQSVMTMPSQDLQRLCRDMAMLSDHVTFRCTSSGLLVECDGDFASQTTEISQTSNGLYISKASASYDDYSICTGRFSLKFLNMFTKANSLSSTVDIYLKNNYPLVLMFSVANLGKILFCLSPLSD